MDFLDESFGAQTSPVELHDLVATPIAPSLIPLGSVRNKAATAAMMSDDPINTYQVLMKDGQEGNTAAYDMQKEAVDKASNKMDMEGLMSILGDKNISIEDKKKAAEGLKNNRFLKDSASLLHSQSLAAGSKGETQYQEAARISSADSIRKIYESRNAVQGLVNAYVASLDSEGQGLNAMAMIGLPFANAINTSKAAEGIAAAQGKPLSFWETLKNLVSSGSATQKLKDSLNNVPADKRVEVAKTILEGISKSNGILFSNDNQYAQADLIKKIFEEGGYSSSDKWIDNLSPILDVIGIGQVVRGTKVAPRASGGVSSGMEEVVHPATWEVVDDTVKAPYKKLSDGVKRIEMNAPVRIENPAAPANIVAQANPEKARGIHEAVVKDQSGEVAGALHGVDREQAIVNDIMPQAATETGAVTAKVSDMERNLRVELGVSREIIDNLTDTGAITFTQAEKAQARALVVNDFKAAEGLVANDAETGISVVGNRLKIDVMYGTAEGGFLTAKDAMDQAKFALRNYGIKDEDITLMRRDGLDYVPTTLAEAGTQEGSYKVRITTSHEITSNNIEDFEPLITKRNLTDSFSATITNNSGSLARNLMDAASMLDPKLTGAGAVATDHISRFEKLLLTKVEDFTNDFVKFPKARQEEITKYLREANQNGIKFNPASLALRFNAEEIESIRKFRDFWNTHYYLENADVVKTLNANGFQMFKNANTELYAKPITKNANIGWFYDPALDDVVRHGKGEGDILYAAGGTYARLRRPIEVNGIEVEHMIVRNTPTEYLRGFRDSDMVLPYREGYFQTQYRKNAQFVDEITTLPNGQTKRRTVAVAKDTAEAQHFADGLARNTGKSYEVRGDVNGMRRGSNEWWDVNAATGRIAQRRRGKLLEDASGLNHLGDGSYIVSPVESAERAAKSISGRIVTRPMLEAAKARFVRQFDNVIISNSIGGKDFPSSSAMLGGKGRFTDKELRDARTNFEYIKYLENGYINSMDETLKQLMNLTAATAGRYSLSTKVGSSVLSAIERGALQISDKSLTSALKGSVYTTTIVSNVLRQWIIQPHQFLRTAAYNPQGWANGQIFDLVGGYITAFINPSANLSAKNKAFNEFIERSGLVASVDKSNLIRGTLLDAADKSNKVMTTITRYTTVPMRKVGFDAGESMNILGHAAAVYEKKMREGLNVLDPAVRDAIHSETRAISGEMNFAGDMPYNQTTPAVLLNFLQVPHKMALQYANRRIPGADRVKMFVADSVLWGTPIAALISAAIGTDVLPDDKFWRETLVDGLESALLNETLSTLAGKTVDLDFSAFAPYDATGWSKIFGALLADGGMMQAIVNSPSGQLFIKDGGRLPNAVGAAARYFGLKDSPDDTTETGLAVLKETAKIFSGASNLFKAQMILETGKLWDKSGLLIEDGLTNYEAVAQMFGIPTKKPRELFEVTDKWRSEEKKHRDTVLSDYKLMKRYLTEQLDDDNTNPEWAIRISEMVMKAYANDPVGQRIILSEFAKDMEGRDNALNRAIMKRMQLPTIGSLRDDIRKAPIADDQKALALSIVDDFEKAIKDANEKKDK